MNIKKEDIKRMMIAHHDVDFCCVYHWIGKVLLHTLTETNCRDEEMLPDSNSIEKFARSIIHAAVICTTTRPITDDEICKTANYVRTQMSFTYNFTDDNEDYKYGGSETVIIDLNINHCYIH